MRPALIRALAAAARLPSNAASPGDIARVQQALIRDVSRGEDFFRSVVIEALGDYKASYAFDAITAVAKLEGPLQDDAALALGKIGDKRALETLAALQRTAPRSAQPIDRRGDLPARRQLQHARNLHHRDAHFADKNPGFQELLRGAAAGLGALAVAGHTESLDALFKIGVPATDDATRAPVALAVATVALRNTALMLPWLEKARIKRRRLRSSAEGVEMLEEDLDKERFFALTRRTYWDARGGLGHPRADADPHREAGLSEHRQVLGGHRLPPCGRRHRRGQRNRPPHQIPRAQHLHAGRSLRSRILRRTLQAEHRSLPRAGARVERGRRRHQAQSGVHDGPPRHALARIW